MLDRGRPSSRSPRRSVRGREALQHASEDWERRRSRSPIARTRPVSRDPMLDFFRSSDDDWATRLRQGAGRRVAALLPRQRRRRPRQSAPFARVQARQQPMGWCVLGPPSEVAG